MEQLVKEFRDDLKNFQEATKKFYAKEMSAKDYKGFSIWKCKDGKGEIFYTANDKSENIFDVNVKLSDLKKSIDNYIR